VTGEPLEIPLPLRILKRYDFTSHKRFEPELRELVRRIRGVPHPRGGGHAAPTPTFIGQEEPTGGEEHYAIRLRFVVLGGTPYLLIQPGWYFTKDGSKPLEGAVMGALSTQWGDANATQPSFETC
jgi:hypothetical protein